MTIPPTHDWNNTYTFSRCSSSGKDGYSAFICSTEIMLLCTTVLLLIEELLQLFSLGVLYYIQQFENIIELSVISLAAVCLGTQELEAHIKWFSAFGIVLAYLGNI